jgi:tetratricopeptide (TPR) repeat protein
MNSKISSVLEKAFQDKAKGNYHKALNRLNEALTKHADEVELYLEAADVCLEGGESLQATQFLKKAFSKFSAEKDRIDAFAREKLGKLGDPVLGKFLLDQAIKRRDLESGCELLEDLQDRTIRELLQRARTKKQTLSSAERGGHALKSEMVLNVMGEALLCLRLGRMKAAVQSFIELLDDKPVENEVLEPFFSSLEKKYPKAGRIRFAYACSLIYAQQYDKAMSRLVQGVRLEPTVAEEALERLRVLTETFEEPPTSLQDALVEILLAKGDVLRAGEILQESLANDSAQAKRVMDLMQPHVGEVSDSLVLHYLYMDAAIAAEQTKRIIEKIKMIRQSDSHRDDLYQWLEKKSSEQFLPADVMMMHGEMALELKEVDRSLEIFKAVISSSPGDAPVVLAMLEKYKGTEPKLAEFYDDQAKKQQSNAPHQADGGVEFEHFENNEFKFSSGSQEELQIETEDEEPDAEAGEPAEQVVKPVELDPGPYARENGEELEDENTGDSDGEDISKSPLELGLEQAAEVAVKGSTPDILWEEEDADGVVELEADKASSGAADDDSWLVLQSDSVMGGETTERPASEEQAPPETSVVETPTEEPAAKTPAEEPKLQETAPPEEAASQISETHVLNLARSLRTAGARLFFHVQDDIPEKPEPEQPGQDRDAGSTAPELDSETEAAPKLSDAAEETPTVSESPERDDVATVDEDSENDSVIDGGEDPDVEVAVPTDSPMTSGPDSTDPFEEQFELFLDGKLDNDSILDLAVEALDRGKYEEARELLHFDPRNEAEELARKRHLIDYHMSVDRPITALEIIDSIDAKSLPDVARREILIKQASCHNKLSDFESAQAVYEKIADEFPSEEVDKMAKSNNERIIKRQRGDALVLEKTTSLQDD